MYYYTGVGSRNTPDHILDIMTRFAKKMEKNGNILRSGGAAGADKAFEDGVENLKEIYYASQATQQAMNIAGNLHPAWDRCSDYAKKLHGRNSFQVLGLDLKTPSKMVVCWTQDGCDSHKTRTIHTGGTGTAISIADQFNIPIYNLQKHSILLQIIKFIET